MSWLIPPGFFAHLVLFFLVPITNRSFSKSQNLWPKLLKRQKFLTTFWTQFIGFLSLFLCTLSLRVSLEDQSTSWLCIKVSHEMLLDFLSEERLDYASERLTNEGKIKSCPVFFSASQKLDIKPTRGRSSRRNSSISLHSQGFPAQDNAHVVPRWQSNTWWCW